MPCITEDLGFILFAEGHLSILRLFFYPECCPGGTKTRASNSFCSNIQREQVVEELSHCSVRKNST